MAEFKNVDVARLEKEIPGSTTEKVMLKAWEDYHKSVLPPDASEVQVRETRRAFYGGFYTAIMLAQSLGADWIPEDVGIQILEAVKKEGFRFYNDVMSYRA